ncbi:MAG: non-heme iron oxygenase ferredoxin subunit [Candidatus Curtissbacteria bacterium]|nr:non-heme iron oxygenase ferredoxin subunit [Candidatus Curtissbacteria bacterium]
MAKVKVAKVSEVPEGELKKVMVGKEPDALFYVGGQIYATTKICTHAQCDLDQNHLMHGEEVECTCHGSQFNVKTGKNTAPPASEPLKTFDVSVEGDEVFVEVQ